MLACANPAFDGPVILFQDVVKVLHRSMSAVLLQSALGFELRNCRRITAVLVGVDDPRRRMVLSAQRGSIHLGRPTFQAGRGCSLFWEDHFFDSAAPVLCELFRLPFAAL